MVRPNEENGVASIWIAIGVAIVVGLGFAWLLFSALRDVNPEHLAMGATNVATIGGIVSGLSLTGTTILGFSGRYRAEVLEQHGGFVRWFLFVGFLLVVLLSLAVAVAVAWPETIYPRLLLSLTVPAIVIVLVATLLLINSAFAWSAPGPKSLEPVKGQR